MRMGCTISRPRTALGPQSALVDMRYIPFVRGTATPCRTDQGTDGQPSPRALIGSTNLGALRAPKAWSRAHQGTPSKSPTKALSLQRSCMPREAQFAGLALLGSLARLFPERSRGVPGCGNPEFKHGAEHIGADPRLFGRGACGVCPGSPELKAAGTGTRFSNSPIRGHEEAACGGVPQATAFLGETACPQEVRNDQLTSRPPTATAPSEGGSRQYGWQSSERRAGPI
jgi:hypothetical protein